jgi:predicted outer membrane repeat protein
MKSSRPFGESGTAARLASFLRSLTACSLLPALVACADASRPSARASGGTAGEPPSSSAGEGGLGFGGSGGAAGEGGNGSGGDGEPLTGHAGLAGHAGKGGAAGGSKPEVSLETLPASTVVIDEEADAVIALGGFDASGRVAQADLLVLIEEPPSDGVLSDDGGPFPFATRYFPRPNFTGPDRFRFVIADLAGHRSPSREVSIEVRPVNDAPFTDDDVASTDSLSPVHIPVLANDFDVDGDDLVVKSVTQPAHGAATITETGDAIVFWPEHPNSGRVTFQYTVWDPSSAEDTARIDVDVIEANVVRITSFTRDRAETAPGEAVELAWISAYASRCDLQNGPSIDGRTSGSISVFPTDSTRYTLRCEGPGGPVTESVVVVVVGGSGTDTDGDGLADLVEELTGTDPGDDDSDDDGVPDGVEDSDANGSVDAGETDPREPDTDADGFCDGLRTDGDGDGVAPSSPCQGPILVDAGNTAEVQDGTTWLTAYADLEQAADEAVPGREVWVKAGRHRPKAANASVLTLRDNLAFYGGFVGTETYLGARAAGSRGTVLDGDFLGDDADVPAIDASAAPNPAANRADNSAHVVYGAEGARLDGFTIAHGHAVADGPFPGGGGLLALYPSLTITNTSFVKNSTTGSGGGILCADRCDLTISASRFEGNLAVNGAGIEASSTLTQGERYLDIDAVEFEGGWASGNGGGFDARGGIAVTARALTCSGNTAVALGGCWFSLDATVEVDGAELSDNSAREGGAAYSWRTSLVLDHAAFLDNTATYSAGALLIYTGTASISNSTLAGNSARFAGAMLIHNAGVGIEHSTLARNTVTESGGAIYSGSVTTLSLKDVTIDTNTARHAAGIFVHQTTLDAEATTFTANSASVSGGGAYIYGGSQVRFDDLAMLGNFATSFGGGIYVTDADYAVTDAVFRGNSTTNMGAGIFQHANAHSELERVTFVQNSANSGVGMMVFGPSSLRGDELAFVGNKGEGGVGLQLDALDSGDGLDVEVRDASFWRNEASLSAAGLFLIKTTNPRIAGVTFGENEATEYGAAVSLQGLAKAALTNATFVANEARYGGAVGSLDGSSVRLNHASFLANKGEVASGVYTQAGSASSLSNSVFWGGLGMGPDVLDLGSASTVANVGSAQPLTGSGNVTLLSDPFELLQPGARLFLKQAIGGPSALDAGSGAAADDPTFGFEAMGLAPWAELTTASDGSLDADSVDLGRHYSPTAVRVNAFSADSEGVSWSTGGADACRLFNDAAAIFSRITGTEVAAGTKTHTHASGTGLALVCFGAEGEPAVAFARVP